ALHSAITCSAFVSKLPCQILGALLGAILCCLDLNQPDGEALCLAFYGLAGSAIMRWWRSRHCRGPIEQKRLPTHFGVPPRRDRRRCQEQTREHERQNRFPLARPNLAGNTARPWGLVLPRIISAEHPQMAFRIPAGISLSAAVLDPYTKDNLGVFSLCFSVVRLDVIHDEIASLRL